jgi:hypothetical protein
MSTNPMHKSEDGITGSSKMAMRIIDDTVPTSPIQNTIMKGLRSFTNLLVRCKIIDKLHPLKTTKI